MALLLDDPDEILEHIAPTRVRNHRLSVDGLRFQVSDIGLRFQVSDIGYNHQGV